MRIVYSPILANAIADLEFALERIQEFQLRDTTGIAIRVDTSLWRLLSDLSESTESELRSQIQNIWDRAPTVQIFLLPTASGLIHVKENTGVFIDSRPRKLPTPDSGLPLLSVASQDESDALQEADLQLILDENKGRCVVTATDSYHFVLPSGAHTNQFLRLAEAFVDIETVDRIAFWCAIKLAQTFASLNENHPPCLLVDHPSMLILASRLRQLLGKEVSIKCLQSYPGDVDSRQKTLELLSQIAAQHSSLSLIIGVASTGNLATLVKNWAQNNGKPEPQVVVLYATQGDLDADIAVLCEARFPSYQHYRNENDCDMCKHDSHRVEINGTTYLVGYAPAESVAIPPSRFRAQRGFIEKYGRITGALRVHYDDPNEDNPRHHSFYIDVGSLIDNDDFAADLQSSLNQLNPRPDLILVPSHHVALRLGKLASETIGCQSRTIDDQISKPINAKTLLILDDVFITGTSFSGTNRRIRAIGGDFSTSLTHIHWYAVIGTPSSQKSEVISRNGLTTNHTWTASLSFLYSVILPDWHSKNDCPWCREQKLLEKIADAGSIFDGPILDRLSELQSTAGLTDQAIWGQPNRLIVPTLANSSVALSAGASPLQVVFACASAVQQQRVAETKPLSHSAFPTPTLLARRTLETNYTEPLLWLGVLRSCRGVELEPALKSFLREQATTLACQREFAYLAAEFSASWLGGNLGPLNRSEKAEALFASIGVNWDTLTNLGLCGPYDAPETTKLAQETPTNDASKRLKAYFSRIQTRLKEYVHLVIRLNPSKQNERP